ncbi:MAG: TetR family transcriptional regulator [Deltaproteobacteria bacterium]|nr:TetR family transcriptional regulator [Deltaproteobacteria bacterium]
MGRPSNRAARRQELLGAFARVLADHGYAGATIAAIATEAGVAPGLVHHHFDDKAELLTALFDDLMARFREGVRRHESDADPLDAYVRAALSHDAHADQIAAKCWVGLFAEALRNPFLFRKVRRLVDQEISMIERRSGGAFSALDAGAILAFVVGALVVGAFAPRKTAGFAARGIQILVAALRSRA